MPPIASEWLRLALKDAQEEIASWPEWLKRGLQAESGGEAAKVQDTATQKSEPEFRLSEAAKDAK